MLVGAASRSTNGFRCQNSDVGVGRSRLNVSQCAIRAQKRSVSRRALERSRSSESTAPVLDRRVVTDGEVLRSALVCTDHVDAQTSLEELRRALSLVGGLPFAVANYVWADAEGITSTLVWLATQAVQKAAALATELNDSTALVEVSSAGLRMMPGDEEFGSLAIRAGTGA